MKSIRRRVAGAVTLAGSICIIQAQIFTDTASSPEGELNQWLTALMATPALPPELLPAVAHGFYSVRHPEWPPLPGNVHGLSAWALGDGFYVLDDRELDYAQLQADAEAEAEAKFLLESLENSLALNRVAAHDPALTGRPYLTNLVAVVETNDLLLIYNTNSADSKFVKDYYLAHRPGVGGANVLGIGCTTNLIAANSDYTNNIQTPYLNWLSENPTKQPQYVVMFLGVPARVTNASGFGSVSYRLRENSPGGYRPYITHLNMGDTNASRAYIDKLATLGTNVSPGNPVLSASAAGYANTNLLFDNVRYGPGWGDTNSLGFEIYGHYMSNDVVAIEVMNIPGIGITYLDGIDRTNDVPPYPAHITNAINVAGYKSWGEHSRLTGEYPMNGKVQWSGNGGWWLIETVESFNGQALSGMGDYIDWFRPDAFGGTNYSNTPVGAVTHVDEPFLPFVNDSSIYFGYWAGRKTFGISAWMSRKTPLLQAVGDPFVTK
jgi:hypothetical protein